MEGNTRVADQRSASFQVETGVVQQAHCESMPATRNEQTVARSLTVRVQVSLRSACVSVLLLSSGAAAFSARPHSVHLGLHRVASTDRLPLPSTRFLRQISVAFRPHYNLQCGCRVAAWLA